VDHTRESLPVIRTFDDARRAIDNGASVHDATRALVATLSDHEKLWCLDGDAPTWAGLKKMSDDGYHKSV